MTGSRQEEIDPRYDPVYQRGGGGVHLPGARQEAPAIVEISDSPAPAQKPAAGNDWSVLEQRQRRYRTAAWALAAGLVSLGIFFLFADALFAQDTTVSQPNWSGYPVEPWQQKLRYTGPNLLMLGILTAIVQVFIEQMQIFRLRIHR